MRLRSMGPGAATVGNVGRRRAGSRRTSRPANRRGGQAGASRHPPEYAGQSPERGIKIPRRLKGKVPEYGGKPLEGRAMEPLTQGARKYPTSESLDHRPRLAGPRSPPSFADMKSAKRR